jgi:hypothetical protein
MVPETGRKIAKILSIITAIAGIIVIIGWIFDIRILESISPAWISMKFDTAFSFLLSGIILYFIARAFEGEFDKAQIAISIASLTLVLLMGTLFFSYFLNVRTGVEDIFVKEIKAAPYTVAPGRPSVPTTFNFMLIAIAGILTMFRYAKLKLVFRIVGLIIGMIGLLPVIGYIINAPPLYYFIEGINSAMAFNTAVLFMLIGTGFICLSE